MDNHRFIDYAAAELEKIGLIDRRDVIDGTLVRIPQAYPAYFGTYGEFGEIRAYLDRFSNL
jgi:protoporphyrinogen oxidase